MIVRRVDGGIFRRGGKRGLSVVSALGSVTVCGVALALGLMSTGGAIGDPLGSAAGGGQPAAPVVSKVKAVVELFTSQGCSSCPPADRLLKTYVDRSDVVALSFPVDYWDYLGWPDTFASQMNTERQRGYARARRDGAVYTPQAVVNGNSHFVGFKKSDIDACINKDMRADGGASLVAMSFSAQGSEFVVEAGPAPSGFSAKQMMFWVAAVQSRGNVDIKRGENRGHNLTYYNIVRGLTPVGSWDGAAKTFRVAKDMVAKPEADTYLVLLQRGAFGPIVGATWLSQ